MTETETVDSVDGPQGTYVFLFPQEGSGDE